MKREKVLIVEDELDLHDLVDFNLSRKGYITSGAMDGTDALLKFDSFKPDLVILDLMLPGLDGWEVCSRLKAKDNATPVLVLTAKTALEDRAAGLEAGADDYMTKPFNVKELLLKVEEMLAFRRGAGKITGGVNRNTASL